MRNVFAVLISFFIIGCSTAENSSGIKDVLDQVDTEDIINEPEIISWTPDPEEPAAECIDCKMYFCPPLDSV